MSIDSDPTGRGREESPTVRGRRGGPTARAQSGDPAVRGRTHEGGGRERRRRTATRGSPRCDRDDGYAHERVAGRSSARPARVGAVLVAVGGVGALVVVVAAALLDSLGSIGFLGSIGSLGPLSSAIGDGVPLLAGVDATVVDPAPLVAVVRLVRDASLVASGITTGVGGCLLALAAVRVRRRR